MKLLESYVLALEKGVQFKQLSKDQLDKLAEPLPDEAIKPIPGKRKLNAINAVYVYELYNEVFGIGGWSYTTEVSFKETAALAKVEFYSPEYGIYRESYGGNDNESGDKGDSAKGAVTDALTKISSSISEGVAKVWKNYYGDNPTISTTSSTNSTVKSVDKIWVNNKLEPAYKQAVKGIEDGTIKTKSQLMEAYAFNTTKPIVKSILTELEAKLA